MMTQARSVFGPGDVQSFAEGASIEMTDTEAEEWLGRNAKHIEEAMVRAGWEAIDDLSYQDSFTKRKD